MNNQNVNTSEGFIEQINVDELNTILLEKKYKIIDVRDANSIETQGSFPEAIHIPFDSVENEIDKDHKNFNTIFNSEGPFLFCCTGGVMSYMAAIKAQEKGIMNVCNLEGGHAAWLKLQELKAA